MKSARPGGKSELALALADLQAERVLQAQRSWLDTLDSWDAWERWRDAVLAHYGPSRTGAARSRPCERAGERGPRARRQLAAHMDRWCGHLRAGVERMRAAGALRADTDPEQLALAIFASLQGGLQLTLTMHSLEPLSAALDGALAALRSHAA